MDNPYELDGFSQVYCPVELEQYKKRSFEPIDELDADIENLKIKPDINLPKLRVEKRNQSITNNVVASNSKKSKHNNFCKRCRVYSFDRCECVVHLFENVYISGKRKKTTYI